MKKREKIFELKIEEDDDISGISSISLVDTPAIEVNWVAFRKEHEHEFHIPEGEDHTYLEKLMPFAQSEQDLLDEGFEIDSIQYLNGEDFVYAYPNAKSDLDDENFRVRYKYVKNPQASGPDVIDTTRHFCKELISKRLIFRLEDMVSQTNDQGSNFADWRGGYNCRHIFAKVLYKRKGQIKKKGGINGAKDGYDILGDEQNDTRTSNPYATISNPSFSKQEFGGKVSFDYDGTLSTGRGQRMAKQLIDNGYDIHIVTARNSGESMAVYQVADRLGISRDKVHFTNGKPKSDILRSLHITKHYDNNPDVIAEIKKNAPLVNAEQFDYNVGTIGGYVDPGIEKKKKKSYLDEFEYLFTNQNVYEQSFAQDSEKHIVLGPAMIPDQKIFRRDNEGNPYYVFFSPETIKMIAEKYMKNKYTDNNDQMHDGEAVQDVFVVESWIKEDEHDKSNKYGFESLPIGTWFVSMKVNNPEIWKKIKEHELNGFSVSGFFEEVASFSREEAFLSELAKLLKDI